MGEVWKSVWDECGGCVEVGESVLGCGEVGESTHSSTPLPASSTLTRHLFPHSSNTSPPHFHTHLTRLSTLSHTHLPPPHTLLHFPTPLSPFLHFPTLTSHTSSQSPRLLQHFPMFPILYYLPHAKISHFSHLLPN